MIGGEEMSLPHQSFKMPKPLNRSKPVSYKAKAAEDKNSRAIVKAFKDGDGAFARVEKEIGFGQFYLRYFDGVQVHEQILATPRGVFFAGGKVRVRISAGDIVLVDGIQMLAPSRRAASAVRSSMEVEHPWLLATLVASSRELRPPRQRKRSYLTMGRRSKRRMRRWMWMRFNEHRLKNEKKVNLFLMVPQAIRGQNAVPRNQ